MKRDRLPRKRVALIVKRSSYRSSSSKGHDDVVTNLFKKRDPTVGRMKQSHEDHEGTVTEVEALGRWARRWFIAAAPLAHQGTRRTSSSPSAATERSSTRLAIGANTPLLGINSAPASPSASSAAA